MNIHNNAVITYLQVFVNLAYFKAHREIDGIRILFK
jgi:hypothetical protein